MPRGRKPRTASAAQPTEQLSPSAGGGATKMRHFKGIVARIESANSRSQDCRSDLGIIYKQADDQGFNRQALKMAIKLSNMEPDKRNDFLTELQVYCDALGIWSQGSLFGVEPQIPTGTSRRHAEAPETPVGPEVGSYNWEQGRTAAHDGKSVDQCQWVGGTPQYETWMAGYAAGRQEIDDGLEGDPDADDADDLDEAALEQLELDEPGTQPEGVEAVA